MDTAQRILKNTLSLLFSGAVAQILSFSAIVYLARVLGPGDFGKISFAIAVIAYFTLATHLGLPLLGTREIARDRGKIGDYFSNILVLRLCLASITFTLLLLVLLFLNKPSEVKRLMLLYGIGLFFSALMIDWLFQGMERMEYIGLGRILTAGVYVGCVFLFVNGPDELFLVPCFQITGVLVTALALIAIFARTFGKPRFRTSLTLCKDMLRQSIPLGISIIMIQIIYNIDTVMLGFMRSDAEIGYYNAAYKIILPLIMVGSIYFDAIFPVISNYYETSLDSLRRLQSYTAKLMAAIALPLACSGTFLARPIMNLVYGSKYESGVGAFQILIWVVALIYLNMIYARGLWACNKQNEYVKIVFGQAIANILLNLLLIPRFGIVGAAVSTVSAEFAGFFFYYREFNKIVYVTIHKYILKPLVASLIMVAYLELARSWNVLFLIPSSLPIYLFSLYLTKGITKEDIKSFQSVFVLNKAR